MEFKEGVINRLDSFGVKTDLNDSYMIGFIVNKVEGHIKNICNVSDIPNRLKIIAVDMATGEFLMTKKATGQLENFDLESAVNSIKIGDTSTTFEKGISVEQRLDMFIDHLMNGSSKELMAFRCVKW